MKLQHMIPNVNISNKGKKYRNIYIKQLKVGMSLKRPMLWRIHI